MADNVPLGMEFMRWQNNPSLTETLAGNKSPLLKTLAILLADSGKQQTEGEAPPSTGAGGLTIPGVPPPSTPKITATPPASYSVTPPSTNATTTAPDDAWENIRNFWLPKQGQ